MAGEVHSIELEDGSMVINVRTNVSSLFRVPRNHIRLFREDGQEALDEDVVEERYFVWIEEPAVVGSLDVCIVDNELTFRRPVNCSLFASAFKLIAKEEEFTREVVERMKIYLWEMDYIVEGLSLSKLIELYFQVFFPKVKVVDVILL